MGAIPFASIIPLTTILVVVEIRVTELARILANAKGINNFEREVFEFLAIPITIGRKNAVAPVLLINPLSPAAASITISTNRSSSKFALCKIQSPTKLTTPFFSNASSHHQQPQDQNKRFTANSRQCTIQKEAIHSKQGSQSFPMRSHPGKPFQWKRERSSTQQCQAQIQFQTSITLSSLSAYLKSYQNLNKS